MTYLVITGQHPVQTMEGIDLISGRVEIDATIKNGRIYITFQYFSNAGLRPFKPVLLEARHLVSELDLSKTIDEYFDDLVAYLNMHLGDGAVARP